MEDAVEGLLAVRGSSLAATEEDVQNEEGKLVDFPDFSHFESFFNGEQYNGMFDAARQSYEMKRSTNSATILLLGLSGAGKSHTINNFFNKEISPVSDATACTKDIIDFSMDLPCPMLNIKNSKLHIVDVPGFDDSTGGLEFDAKVLTNVRKYFQDKSYMPTIILLAVNVTENRLVGKFSKYSKLLQALKFELESTVLDFEHPNLVIVATNYCRLSQPEQENICSKIEAIKQVTMGNLGLIDVPVVLAENKFQEYDLPKVGDYYQLPNGELYPRNIFESVTRLIQTLDPIGHGIVTEAFPKLAAMSQVINKEVIPLQDLPRVHDVLDLLKKLQLQKVSQLERFATVLLTTAGTAGGLPRPPGAPTNIGRSLATLSSIDRENLPKSNKDKMELLRNLAPNRQEQLFLQNTFNIQAPSFGGEALSLGKSYDMVKEKVMRDAVILELGNMTLNYMGCSLPGNLRAEYAPHRGTVCHIRDSSLKLFHQRLQDLGISGMDEAGAENLLTSFIEPEHRPGYNLINDSRAQLTEVFEHRMIKLEFNPDSPIHPNFVSHVEALPSEFLDSNSENLVQWDDFFKTFGTHFVSQAYLGGEIIFYINEWSGSEEVLGDPDEFQDHFFRELSQGNVNYRFQVLGGDKEAADNLSKSQNLIEYRQNYMEWRASLWEDLIGSDLSIKLEPISSVVRRVRPDVVSALEEAMLVLMGIPTPDPEEDETLECPTRASDARGMQQGQVALKIHAFLAVMRGNPGIGRAWQMALNFALCQVLGVDFQAAMIVRDVLTNIFNWWFPPGNDHS